MDWQLNPVAGADFDEARNTSLSKQVRDQLLGQILSGVFTPGQALHEPELVDRLKALLGDGGKDTHLWNTPSVRYSSPRAIPAWRRNSKAWPISS